MKQPRTNPCNEGRKERAVHMDVKGLGAGIHLKEPHHQQTRDYLFRVLKVIDRPDANARSRPGSGKLVAVVGLDPACARKGGVGELASR